MQDTPKGMRVHIGFLGRCNVGKSSLLNAVVGQSVAIVSELPGTTTDPVEKTMELAPIGPVVLVDTAGLDDAGELGSVRAEKTRDMLGRMDAVVLVSDRQWGEQENGLLHELERRNIPCVIALNKLDVDDVLAEALPDMAGKFPVVRVSARTGEGLADLCEALARILPDEPRRQLAADLLPCRGVAVLVVPIDTGAPRGRLILPQVQTIRDLLDGRRISVVVTEEELGHVLACLGDTINLVICDSQVVHRVAAETPLSIPLTTFSILMARFKGDLAELAAGAAAIRHLRPGDRVLVQEACSHHPQQDDIGRIKIPRLLNRSVGGDLQFETFSGKSFHRYDAGLALVVHCGGCTMTRRQMCTRLAAARAAGIPMTNYGVAISYCQGVLDRVLSPFPEALSAYRRALCGKGQPTAG